MICVVVLIYRDEFRMDCFVSHLWRDPRNDSAMLSLRTEGEAIFLTVASGATPDAFVSGLCSDTTCNLLGKFITVGTDP